MYSDWSVLVGFTMAVIFIWVGILSFLIWKQNIFLKSLFPKSGERDIRRKFEEVLGQIEDFGQDLENVRNESSIVKKLGLSHIQRVELLRYNPYDDTGGDQSFTICLLNDLGSGVVVTSLHARSGTRVFAKPVLQGKADKYQFSKEEEEIVRKTLKQSKAI